MSRFSPQSNVFTSLREALFKGASHVKTTYDKVVWSVKKRGVQRGGDVAEKTMGQLYSIVMQIALM